MALDDRNFRSTYYGKVGFKGIEEMKSLEIILKEEPIDYLKMSQFCLKFPVPSAYRYLIWQVLLGVLPCHQSAHAFAFEQRKLQYEELKNALEIMRKIDAKTPREIVFLKMYLIEEKSLPFDDGESKLVTDHLPFFQIAKVFSELVCEDVRAFWLAVKFARLLEKNIVVNLRQMSAEIETILNREDADFHSFVRKHNLLESIPLRSLLLSAFASLFPEDFAEKIWDRVIGGGGAFLCYVSVAILLVTKRQSLSTASLNHVLKGISVDHCELILSMATDIWSKDGCPLVIPN